MYSDEAHLRFNTLKDSRGNLIALEAMKNIPINIQRVYYIWGLNKEPRGFHAHRITKQVLICIQGSLELLFDDGKGMKKNIHLSSPSEGVFIDTWLWHEMHNFSDNCILVVLASHQYDESDYIRSYDKFLKEVQKRSV